MSSVNPSPNSLPSAPLSSASSSLEKFLLKRIYGKKYTELNDTARRGFVNHHIAGATKIVILLIAAYPFIYVIAKGDFHSRLIGFITMGDVLIVAAQM
jgi:hypothetical protein